MVDLVMLAYTTAALAGAVVTLGITEVAFSTRRKLDPSSPWVAAWCGAVALYLVGRYLEIHEVSFGVRLRFLAEIPMASLAIGIVRARARPPLSRRAVTTLAILTAATISGFYVAPLRLVVTLIGVAIVLLGGFAVFTLVRAKTMSGNQRTVGLVVVALMVGTALNDILLQLGLATTVHLVEFALVALPLLHNYRLVTNVQQRNADLELAVADRTEGMVRRSRELEVAVAATQVARDQADSSRRQLEHADRLVSLGTLAAGVAHEINNPLSYVRGNLAMIGEQLPSGANPDLAAMVRDAHEGTSRIQRIVRDLKAFSGTNHEDAQLLELDEHIDAALTMLGSVLRPRVIIDRVRGFTPSVCGDRVRIGQVLVNLLRNASEALPEVGVDSRIRVITGTTDAGEAFVSIVDNGPGIAPDVLPRIFEPFFTTKPIVGTGLGLSICYGIIRAMGGEIDVDSQLGRGARFTLRLPAAELAPASVARATDKPATEATPTPTGARRHILIVDDDPMVARALVRALRGHDTVVVHAGEDVVARCREHQFDLILCDLSMPGMGGADVYAALESMGLADRVVIVTGGAYTETARRFLARSSVRRLEKPVDLVALRELVEQQPRHDGVRP